MGWVLNARVSNGVISAGVAGRGGDHLLEGGRRGQVFMVESFDAGFKISMFTKAGADEASAPEKILILSPFPHTILLRV